MKVETDLRAGGVLEDASSQASSFVNDVNSFFGQLSAEAQSAVDDANRAATSIWTCLTNSLS